MAIVSLSFPDQMIREMDQIQRSGGFAGRSELVRSAIRLLLEDSREKNALSGHMNAIIVVTHDESNEAPITKLKHEFDIEFVLELRYRRFVGLVVSYNYDGVHVSRECVLFPGVFQQQPNC